MRADTNGPGPSGDATFQRFSLADQVSDAILNMVRASDLQPGEPLPSTGELASRFGVSLSVVREALAVLDGRGIVDRSQGREATLAEPGSAELEYLLTYRWSRGHLSRQAVMELRCCIEVQAARLAAERLDVAGAAELDKAHAALADAQAEDDQLRADVGFHRAVAFASGNELLALVLDAVSPLLRQARHDAQVAHRGGIDDIVADHQAILAGILSGDPDVAARAMTDHLEHTLRSF